MPVLSDFRSMDFLDRIGLLAQLEKEGDVASLGGLYELFLQPALDPAVDTMLRNCLRNLLSRHEGEMLAQLASGPRPIQQLCLGLVAEKKLAAAAPALMQMAGETAADADLYGDVLSTMAQIRAPEFLPLFQGLYTSGDEMMKSLGFEMAGAYADVSALPLLFAQIDGNASLERYELCELSTWKAIEALGAIATEDAIAFLAAQIHHRTPAARRCVHEALHSLGGRAIAHVAPMLDSADRDVRIMAANILGNIGDRKACDHLLHALHEGPCDDLNLKFAIYEALGKTHGMKSMVALLDALSTETEPMLLMAITHGLDSQANPGLGNQLRKILSGKTDHADAMQPQRIIDAIIGSKAVRLFSLLYVDDDLADQLVDLLAESTDSETLSLFLGVLESLPQPRAATDAVRLQARMDTAPSDTRGRLLAIDDSKAMLNFYRSIGASLQFEVVTAENGREALDLLEFGEEFDVIVVDMNMPVMDGVEFTAKARALEHYVSTPILMATTESAKSQAMAARNAGVTGFLKKPFTLELLQHRIAQLLES